MSRYTWNDVLYPDVEPSPIQPGRLFDGNGVEHDLPAVFVDTDTGDVHFLMPSPDNGTYEIDHEAGQARVYQICIPPPLKITGR